MSDTKRIFQIAAEVLSHVIGIEEDEIRSETPLLSDPTMELIDITRYVIACEKKFDIVIHDEDVHTFLCFEDSVRYIEGILYEGGQSVAVATDEERVAWYYG